MDLVEQFVCVPGTGGEETGMASTKDTPFFPVFRNLSVRVFSKRCEWHNVKTVETGFCQFWRYAFGRFKQKLFGAQSAWMKWVQCKGANTTPSVNFIIDDPKRFTLGHCRAQDVIQSSRVQLLPKSPQFYAAYGNVLQNAGQGVVEIGERMWNLLLIYFQ